jgi:hypothetical protein
MGYSGAGNDDPAAHVLAPVHLHAVAHLEYQLLYDLALELDVVPVTQDGHWTADTADGAEEVDIDPGSARGFVRGISWKLVGHRHLADNQSVIQAGPYGILRNESLAGVEQVLIGGHMLICLVFRE